MGQDHPLQLLQGEVLDDVGVVDLIDGTGSSGMPHVGDDVDPIERATVDVDVVVEGEIAAPDAELSGRASSLSWLTTRGSTSCCPASACMPRFPPP